MGKVSARSEQILVSPIQKLIPLAEEVRARGTKIYHLNIGQPDLPTPEEGLDKLKHINANILGYGPGEGYKSLREKLVKYYKGFNIDFSAEDIIVTAGGSEAVFFAFLASMNPGDEIIMPEPTYANYVGLAIAAGVVVRPVISHIEDGYKLPPVSEFEKLINNKTRGILICNPNNPTGYLYTREEMEQICSLVKKHDLYLFSDEVYREFIYSDGEYVSAGHLMEIADKVILIDSFSKRYSECGIRVGTLISRDKDLREAVMKFSSARICPPMLGQIIAEASLDVPESFYKNTYEEYLRRRDCLLEGLNSIPGVFAPVPNGTFYAMARFPIDDCDRFCEWCLNEFEDNGETVMIAPGSGFYSDTTLGRDEVRFAFVLNCEDLKRSVEILRKALECYPGKTI